ncbi:MAG TPA: phosphoribosyltransferase family protein [Steroidobacteraceae bacterium]|jgi:putative phosphoribosyl transferase|nr:phosphoribosyltransferase family protein [Steroidobacteraceae bacterium]
MQRSFDAFPDRLTAGAELGRAVRKLNLRPPIIVLGLPRGGVPVAYEVARALGAPLDVLVVRKVGMPGQPELAIGAVAGGGIVVHEPGVEPYLDTLGARFDQLAEIERRELERRERAYRGDAPPLQLTGKTVVLVDDGLATGSTMLAAVRAARKAGAREIVVAAPVASDEALALVGAEADEMVVLKTPAYLFAIGYWYQNFDQVSDAEVCELLERSRSATPHGASDNR